MAGTLANPSFVTGARDDLAAADVYTLSSNTPINSIDSKATVFTDSKNISKVNQLAGGKSMLNTIKAGLGAAKAAKALMAKGGDPLSRMAQAQSGVSALVRSLPSSMSGLSSKLVSGVQGLSTITATVNGTTQRLKIGSDLSKITALGNMINAASCDKKVFSINDQGATVGAYSGVINTAMQNGIPGAYGAVLKCESDPRVLNQVTAACLPSTIQMGDIQSLSAMADKVQPGTIRNLNPNVISDFTSNYLMPTGTTTQGMQEQYGMAKDTFGKIDPAWNTTTRNGESVIDLTRVQGASTDFQTVMTTGIMTDRNATTEEQLLLTAQKFPPVSVTDQLQSQFPRTTVLQPMPNYSTSSSPVVDPMDQALVNSSIATDNALASSAKKTDASLANASSNMDAALNSANASAAAYNPIPNDSTTVSYDDDGNRHERLTIYSADGSFIWREIVIDKNGKVLKTISGP